MSDDQGTSLTSSLEKMTSPGLKGKLANLGPSCDGAAFGSLSSQWAEGGTCRALFRSLVGKNHTLQLALFCLSGSPKLPSS